MNNEVTLTVVKNEVVVNGVVVVREISTANFVCITTEKMPIVNHVCVLPSKPLGDFFFNLAHVYIPYGTDGEMMMEMSECIELDVVNGEYVLRFTDTTSDYTGNFAVVSYVGAAA